MIDLFKKGVGHALAHLGYFSGLSALIPVAAGALKLNQAPWNVFPPTFYIAAGVILISMIFLFMLHKGIGNTLIAMGLMTIIPGVLALFFSVISQESVFNAFSAKITGFSVVAPAFSFFVDHAVPKTTWIAIGYIIGGYLTWKIGIKLKEGF